MTVAWLLANDLKQISDCTGGRKMQFDTASQNNLKKKSFIRNGKIANKREQRELALYAEREQSRR